MLAFIRPAFAINDQAAYWKLDGDALDYSSGGSNDGTPQGGPVYVSGGMRAGAVTIDGVDDQLLMPVGALKPTPSLSYGGWFRPEDAGNDATKPVGWDGGSAEAYALSIDQAGAEGFSCTMLQGVTPLTARWETAVNNQWYHVFCVIDDAAKEIRLYVDSVLCATETYTGTINYPGFGSQRLYIGKDPTPGQLTYIGLADDIRLYDRALSDVEIQTLYSGCIDPVAAEGVLLYNEDQNVPQYCNGRDWAALARLNPAAGGSGCTSPSAPEGVILYNSGLHVPQFCDGDDWVALGAFPHCPVAKGGDGYFVITAGTWNGDLQAASGMGDGFAAANKLCLDDLTANDWKGKTEAQARGLLNAAHVKAFICIGGGNSANYGCNNALPDTAYYFAVSGDAAKGGASFRTDTLGRGPGDSQNWSGGSYFDGAKDFWTSRGSVSEPAWSAGGEWSAACGSTPSVAAGAWDENTPNGHIGSTNNTDSQRWKSSSAQSCATLRHLVCMVHP